MNIDSIITNANTFPTHFDNNGNKINLLLPIKNENDLDAIESKIKSNKNFRTSLVIIYSINIKKKILLLGFKCILSDILCSYSYI